MITTTAPASRSAPLSHAQAYGLLALVVFVWGANWPTMKMGLHHITPLWFAVARFWMGSLHDGIQAQVDIGLIGCRRIGRLRKGTDPAELLIETAQIFEARRQNERRRT